MPAHKDPEARKAYYKRWCEENLEARRTYDRRYYEENREAIKARTKRWVEENREWVRERNKRYNKENREKLVVAEQRHRFKKYQITQAEYTQMVIDQAGLCYMCERQMTRPSEPQVDHDHETGFVRALLCFKCNVGLHYVESSEFMEWAKKYLEQFPRW